MTGIGYLLGRSGGHRIGIFKKIGYVFIAILFIALFSMIVEGVANSRDSDLSQLLMAILFTSTSFSILFLSLDHYKKTNQDKKSKQSLMLMLFVALLFLGLAGVEAVPLF